MSRMKFTVGFIRLEAGAFLRETVIADDLVLLRGETGIPPNAVGVFGNRDRRLVDQCAFERNSDGGFSKRGTCLDAEFGSDGLAPNPMPLAPAPWLEEETKSITKP